MSIFAAILYGIIQGMTEFLPVSSSAHLIILPLFLGWKDPGLAFDVALHWGTLIGVVIYYRRDLYAMGKAGFRCIVAGSEGRVSTASSTPPGASSLRLLLLLSLATVPGAVMGVVFEEMAESVFRSPWILAGMLSGVGILLLYADRKERRRLSLEELRWGKALLIGLAQGIAIVPGTSRSGITIAVALLLGLDRSDAVRFSFLLSIPIIFGAGVLKAGYLLANAGNVSMWIGLLTAALSGYAAIYFLVHFVRTKSFTPFVLYRLALALLLLYRYSV